ncbi:BTAD domain-containing putative transcriptional regulator [Streptomyces sp. NPDC005151]
MTQPATESPASPGTLSDGVPSLSIRVLGAVEITGSRAGRTPSAPMAKRLLASLLLHANEAVRVSTLVDELWDGEPPRLARKTIQTYVYQLRKEFAGGFGERLLTCPNGYQVSLGRDEYDLWQFEQYLARGHVALDEDDPREAARVLRAALALWRGDAFANIDTGPSLAALIAPLADARMTTIRLRAEADLRLGRHQQILGELRQLTAEHPLNEDFAGQFMLAAYRSGQRTAALHAFAQLRRALVSELGIEPSHRLQRLQSDVLNESPVLDLGPSAAVDAPDRTATKAARPTSRQLPIAQLPSGINDFVGQQTQLDAIVRHARTPCDGPLPAAPQLVTVLGGVGTGKSTVAIRAAHLLRSHFQDGQLYVRLHDEDGGPVDPRTALRSLLRDIGMPVSQIPERTDELARVFRDWSAHRRLLLTLDDAGTPEQVLPLLPGGSRSAVLVTSRVRLPGLPGSVIVKMAPMATDDALTLLSSLAGRERIEADLDAARRVIRLTGNHVLGVRAAGETLLARPMWSVTEMADRLASETCRLDELSSGSLDLEGRMVSGCLRLAERERGALARLARMGAPFGVARAAGVLAVDTWDAELMLGRLLDHHMVELADAGPGSAQTYRIPELIRLATGSGPRPQRRGAADPGGVR